MKNVLKLDLDPYSGFMAGETGDSSNKGRLQNVIFLQREIYCDDPHTVLS